MKANSTFFITDNNNQQHQIFQITEKQFEQYQNENELMYCKNIFEEYKFIVYKLRDGKLIVKEAGKYALYPSLGLLIEVLKGYTGPHTRQILYGKNPFGESFPRKANEIIDNMLEDLKLGSKNFKREDIFKDWIV